MGLNNKGQTFLLAVVIAFGVFMFGILFINFIPDIVTQSRTDLSCSSPTTISDGTKIMCLATDGVVPYFIITLISIAIGGITAKLKLS